MTALVAAAGQAAGWTIAGVAFGFVAWVVLMGGGL